MRAGQYGEGVNDLAPVNPLVATWRWLGYWSDRGEPFVTGLSVLGTTGGGAGITISPYWWILIVAAVALPIPGIFWRRRAAEDDVRSDARERLMEESLPALLELAATTTSQLRDERRRVAESAALRVVGDLRNAFDDVAGVRVVVFRINDDGTRMDPLQPAGRHDRPSSFMRGTDRGDKAFAVLEGDPPFVMVENLDAATPGEWAGTGDGYKTFITAPIRSSVEGFGLLTVDAPVAGSLEPRHGATLALFASAIGVFFAEATRSGGGPR